MSETPPDGSAASDAAFEAEGHHYQELRVARVIRETADAASFVLDVPPALAADFSYRAGQFLTFQVEVQGQELVRCYSLASSPDTDSELKVTVKRVVEGRVSNWMNDQLGQGDRVRVLPPAGLFVLRNSDRPLMLLGGGSGITPVLSILKTALVTTGRAVKLVYANRDEASIIFREEIAELVEANGGRLEVVHHLDAEKGFLTPETVAVHLENWGRADFYICGPGPFMDTVERAVAALPERGHIFIERFVSPPDPGSRDLPTDEELAAQASDSTVLMTLEGAEHEVACSKDQNLLQAALAQGVKPPFSCEDGYCGCCMAKLVKGTVTMRCHDALTEAEVERGWILTCQARPTATYCQVDYDAAVSFDDD